MKTRLSISAALCGLVSAAIPAEAQEARFDALANSPQFENRPTPDAAAALTDELLFQRATQAYLWAMPLINTMGMKVGSEEKFGAGYHVLPIWKKRLSAKTLVTTPNSDVIYAMSYVDLGKDGPLVFDAPPMLQGILLDFWQRPIPGPTLRGQSYLGDVGFAGPDQGKGGKFLLLPSDYNGAIPDGYYVFRSQTNNVFIFLRGFYQDPADLSPGVKTLEGVRVYPLGREKEARAMTYPDASDVLANMLPRKDASAFEQLKQLVDTEPASLADPDWIGLLAAIGIEKGKPFQPDAKTRRILDAAATTAYQMSRVLGTRSEINGVSYKVYPDRQWINPMASGNPFDMAWHRPLDGSLALDARIELLHQLLLVEPGHGLANPREGRELHGRQLRRAGRAALRQQELQAPPSAERSSGKFLVGHALRRRALLRSRQRPVLSLPRFARQAGGERRRLDRPLFRREGANGEGEELVGHRSGPRVLRYHQALQPDRSVLRRFVEAKRL